MARPEFVAFDTKQREEFLSQHGNFSPGERDLFHKLCQAWQERIPYNRFSAQLNRDGGGTAGDLVTLLSKLREEKIGLMRTAMKDGQREREAIVLTDQDSARFYFELIDEYFVDLSESIVNPLPLASHVEEDFGPVPSSVLEQVAPDQLASYFSREPEGDRALAVASLEDDRLLVTHKHLRAFINIAILKLRYYLSNTTLLGIVAKLLDTSLIGLKQKVGGKEPSFWLALTRVITEKRADIEAVRNVSIDKNFYHSGWLLKSLIESQMIEAAEKKKEAENRALDLEAAALAVKEASEGWVDQAGLTDILEAQQERYGESFESFKEEFYERYVKSHGKNSLPKIVQLDDHYIHRDSVYPMFMAHFKMIAGEIQSVFVDRMEQQLRSNNRDNDLTFYDSENFNDAIHRVVEERSELLAKLISKPVVLAEGLILHAKQNKLVKDVTELKARLALYFDPETMKPLPLYEWFNLRLLGIFEQAFERLPLLKRIWIRISGKYETFRGRFLGEGKISATGEKLLSEKQKREIERRSAQKEGQKPERKKSADSGKGRSTTSAASDRPGRSSVTSKRSGSSSGRSSETRSRAAKPSVESAYSKKQVDSAWEQFGSSVKKKD